MSFFFRQRETIDLHKGSIKSYLAVIAKRKAIDKYRSVKNKQTISLQEMGDAARADTNELETAIYNRKTRDLLIQAIITLGEPDSEIFIRKYYFGESTKIIVKKLRLKENTVDKKVSRGLVKLKQALGGMP